MTANKSNTTSFMSTNYKQKLFDVKMFIMLIILNLLALPYLFISLLFQETLSSLFISFIAITFIFGAGIFIPILKFSHLNQRSKVDMVYALPLTRKQQFLSDYFAGLTLYLVPYLFQMLLIQMLPLVFTKNMNTNNYYSLGLADSFYDHLQMFYLTIIILFIMILLYTLTVFIISCTGNLFEAITASLYCNILIPALFLTIQSNIVGSLYSVNSSNLLDTILMRTSPIGGLYYLLSNYGSMSLKSILGFILPVTLCIIILFFLSLRIQNNRKAEDVSKPFVIKAFYYSVISCIVFILGTILYKNKMGYINLILILTIFFFLFELISNRGITNLYRSVARYAIIVSSVVLFLFFYTKTEGFGIVYRTSKTSNVSSISYSTDGILVQSDYPSNYFTIEDPENIKLLLEFHKRQIKKYKVNANNDDYNNDIANTEMALPQAAQSKYYMDKDFATEENVEVPTVTQDSIVNSRFYININFDVKLGVDYSRNYYADFDDMLLLSSIELSDEYIDALMEKTKRYNSVLISDVYGSRVVELNNKKEDLMNGLLHALSLDLKDIRLEDYLKPEGSTGMVLTLVNNTKMTVNPRFTRTIDYLKSNHLWIETDISTLLSLLTTSEIFIVAPTNTDGDADDNQYYTSKYDYDSIIGTRKITELTEDVSTLLSNVPYQYITEDPSYYLFVDRYRFVIPAEYSEVAESVYNYFSK